MHISRTRFFFFGLLASIVAIAACGGPPPPSTSSTFADGATSNGDAGVTPTPTGDDASGADTASQPPISFPEAQAPDVSVDACASGACDDATMTSVCGDGII